MLDLSRPRFLLAIATFALFALTFRALNVSTSLQPRLSEASACASAPAAAPPLSGHDQVSIIYDPRTESDYQPHRPDVAKVSMLYGENELYMRAIDTHVRHARRHRYPAYVLRKDLVDGVWNKLLYLIHVMVAEMHKGEEGARWVMWVDADSAVVNPALPLSIFLPPDTHPDIHMLASKDQSGFNAGMFFMKINNWSIKTLTRAMTYDWHKPDIQLSFLEQTSLYHEMNHTANRPHVLYHPRQWYNTYEFHHAYEGKKGCMLVHFPGLGDDRWAHMSKWLHILEGPSQAEWEVPLEETHYPQEIAGFWSMLDACKQALVEGKERLGNAGDHEEDLKAAVDKLETVLWSETDQMEAMKLAAAEMHDILKAAESG